MAIGAAAWINFGSLVAKTTWTHHRYRLDHNRNGDDLEDVVVDMPGASHACTKRLCPFRPGACGEILGIFCWSIPGLSSKPHARKLRYPILPGIAVMLGTFPEDPPRLAP